MSQTSPTQGLTPSTAVTSVEGTAPILVNGVSGVPEMGDVVISVDDSVATVYETDSGNAVPALNILQVLGGTLLNTTGATNVVTVNADDNVVGGVDTDSGSAVPTSNAFTISGSGSTTTSASGDTVTVELTNLTNHAVLVGAGTATITKVGPTSTAGQVLQSSGASSDPAFSTATYPLTTTINQLLYSSSANVVSGLATANSAVVTTGATGVPVCTALSTDGQLIIGSTSGAPAAASITSTGGTVEITEGSNSINLEVVSGGFPWTNVSGTSDNLVSSNGYEANNAGLVTLTMPALIDSNFGDTIKVMGFGAGGWKIQCVAGQTIQFGNQVTSSGGSISSTDRYDQIEIMCAVNTIKWVVRYAIGNFTIA